MRRGELLALRWSAVYMDARSLRVCRTADYIPGFGYVVNEPKTAAGRRMIMLPAFAVEMLKRHRVEQLEARLKIGASWEDLDLVITDLNGGYFNPRYLEKTFTESSLG
jgi:integrase